MNIISGATGEGFRVRRAAAVSAGPNQPKEETAAVPRPRPTVARKRDGEHHCDGDQQEDGR